MLTGILTGLSWLSTIWFAAHMLDHRARLYWLAGMTAWVEGIEWLTGELRMLLCGFALGILWRSRDLDDWAAWAFLVGSPGVSLRTYPAPGRIA